jgi:hypothetical protein
MPGLFDRILAIDHNITRRFEFDYLIFDALFLAVYVVALIRAKRHVPLKAGLGFVLPIYLIDAVIWTALGVREYGISAPWMKHAVDFMMDVSYAIVAFSWMWIAFEKRSLRDVALWTMGLFAGWLLVPVLSRIFHVNDEPIVTIRHMESQVWLQILAVIAGYVVLLVLKYDWRTILYVFCVGCTLSFLMEFSLMVTGIRPPNAELLAYETLILTNQGVPYVYVIWDKILPALKRRLAARKAVEVA